MNQDKETAIKLEPLPLNSESVDEMSVHMHRSPGPNLNTDNDKDTVSAESSFGKYFKMANAGSTPTQNSLVSVVTGNSAANTAANLAANAAANLAANTAANCGTNAAPTPIESILASTTDGDLGQMNRQQLFAFSIRSRDVAIRSDNVRKECEQLRQQLQQQPLRQQRDDAELRRRHEQELAELRRRHEQELVELRRDQEERKKREERFWALTLRFTSQQQNEIQEIVFGGNRGPGAASAGQGRRTSSGF